MPATREQNQQGDDCEDPHAYHTRFMIRREDEEVAKVVIHT